MAELGAAEVLQLALEFACCSVPSCQPLTPLRHRKPQQKNERQQRTRLYLPVALVINSLSLLLD